jgi:hypothetical protein
VSDKPFCMYSLGVHFVICNTETGSQQVGNDLRCISCVMASPRRWNLSISLKAPE